MTRHADTRVTYLEPLRLPLAPQQLVSQCRSLHTAARLLLLAQTPKTRCLLLHEPPPPPQLLNRFQIFLATPPAVLRVVRKYFQCARVVSLERGGRALHSGDFELGSASRLGAHLAVILRRLLVHTLLVQHILQAPGVLFQARLVMDL